MDRTKVRHVVEHTTQDNVVGHGEDRRGQEKETDAGYEDGEVVGLKGGDFPHGKAHDEEEAAPWECRSDPPGLVAYVEIYVMCSGSQKDNKKDDRGNLAG